MCRGRALGEAGVPCEPSAAPGTRPPLPEGQGDRLQGCPHPRTPVPSPRSPGLLLPCLQLVPGAPHRKTPSRGLKSLCRPDALDLGNAPCARWALLLPACRPLCSSNSGAKPQSPRLLPSGTPRLAVPPPPRPLGLEAEEGGGRSVAEAIRAVLQDTDSAVPPSEHLQVHGPVPVCLHCLFAPVSRLTCPVCPPPCLSPPGDPTCSHRGGTAAPPTTPGQEQRARGLALSGQTPAGQPAALPRPPSALSRLDKTQTPPGQAWGR